MTDYKKIKGGWRFQDGIEITHSDYNRILSTAFGGNKRTIRAMKKTYEHDILCYIHNLMIDMVRYYLEKHGMDEDRR